MRVIYLYLFVVVCSVILAQVMCFQIIKREVDADYKAILNDGSKNSLGRTWHRQGFLKVLGLNAIIAAPFVLISWQTALALLFLHGAEFWLFFDLGLNKKRQYPFGYIGKTATIDKLFRRLFERNAEPVMFIIKVVLLVVSAELLAFFIWKTLEKDGFSLFQI